MVAGWTLGAGCGHPWEHLQAGTGETSDGCGVVPHRAHVGLKSYLSERVGRLVWRSGGDSQRSPLRSVSGW